MTELVDSKEKKEIKFIKTNILNIAYEESGAPDGFPVILLHGFQYDPRSWDKVVPVLASKGYRVLVPYLRGYGQTSFLDPQVERTGEQAAIGQDLMDFTSVLDIEEYAVSGYDWGNRAACIASVLEPQKIKAMVSINGYSIQNTLERKSPPTGLQTARLWYQWYFHTEQGRTGLEKYRHSIIRHLWETWSPTWNYNDESYNSSAPSFENPDFVDVVLHSYRHRHMNAPGEKRFLEMEKMLASEPIIDVPTIVLRGKASGFGTPSENPIGDNRNFNNLVDRLLVENAGHDLPVQRPDAVIDSIVKLTGD